MSEIIELYANPAVYDRMFDHTDGNPFYVERVSQYGSDCLEICCGTGRILLDIAAAGIEAYGLDYSAAMLDEAHKKAASKGLNLQGRSSTRWRASPRLWICLRPAFAWSTKAARGSSAAAQ